LQGGGPGTGEGRKIRGKKMKRRTAESAEYAEGGEDAEGNGENEGR
jgi:hypothetical protein